MRDVRTSTIVTTFSFALLCCGCLHVSYSCDGPSYRCTDYDQMSGREHEYPATVVSGFWRIPNKYGMSFYNSVLKNSVSINSPTVFFYGDHDTFDFVSYFRRGLPTCWVHFTMQDMEAKFANASSGVPIRTSSTSKGSPELWLVWNSKVLLLNITAGLNPFSTLWFAWVDAGLNAFRSTPPPEEPWPSHATLARLPTDKLVYSKVAADWANCFSGSSFMMHATFVSRFTAIYYSTLSEHCHADNHAACWDDQQAMSFILKENPDLFWSVTEMHSHPPINDACPVNCGWSCVVTVLYSEPYVCMDPALC